MGLFSKNHRRHRRRTFIADEFRKNQNLKSIGRSNFSLVDDGSISRTDIIVVDRKRNLVSFLDHLETIRFEIREDQLKIINK